MVDYMVHTTSLANSPEDRRLFSKEIKKRWESTKIAVVPRARELRVGFHFFSKSILAIIGLAMVMTVCIMALLAPFLAPPLPGANPLLVPADLSPPKPPGSIGTIGGHSTTFYMGTGNNGEDIYYGVIWGARTALLAAVTIIGISALIGIVLGAIAGYYGGMVDELLMRITDVFFAVPALILAMAIVAMTTRSLDMIIIALIITWWPGYARLVRGQVLSVRESVYVEAARAVGATNNRILFRHVLPNSLAPVIVAITMDMSIVVLVTAGLSFIGFAPSHLADWGRLLSESQGYVFSQIPYPFPDGPLYNPWWMWVFPSIFLLVFALGFNLLGDGLRDIMDPRLRR